MSPEDEAFVDRLRSAYEPPPMTAFDETRFDARLRARIEATGRRRRMGLGALAVAAAAAVLALVTIDVAPTEAPAVDWLAALEGPEATWAGEVIVVPADPLAVPSLSDELAWAAAGDGATDAADVAADDSAELDDAADEGPAWMPAEYEMLAQLIEVDPYTFEEEEWP